MVSTLIVYAYFMVNTNGSIMYLMQCWFGLHLNSFQPYSYRMKYQASKKSDFIVALLWCGLLQLASTTRSCVGPQDQCGNLLQLNSYSYILIYSYIFGSSFHIQKFKCCGCIISTQQIDANIYHETIQADQVPPQCIFIFIFINIFTQEDYSAEYC